MKFPQLNDWENTSRALHQASMLLGTIQNAVLSPRKNYLHMPFFVEPDGIVSQKLPQGGRIHVNYKAANIIYRPGTGGEQRFAMADHTQASLFEALLSALKQDELAAFYEGVVSDKLAAGMLAKLHADKSRVEFLRLEDVTATDPLTVNSQTASDYAGVLYGALTGVARFRARLAGHMTPVVVWAEHFDLSTLWFPPENAVMDDGKAHINFGFAPFSPGFELPYLYVYMYPYPDDFVPPELPDPATWNTEGFRGIVVRYPDLMAQDDAVQFIEALYGQLFDILIAHLNMA
jgi:hypothetical protein